MNGDLPLGHKDSSPDPILCNIISLVSRKLILQTSVSTKDISAMQDSAARGTTVKAICQLMCCWICGDDTVFTTLQMRKTSLMMID
jgi:hypothetical protein